MKHAWWRISTIVILFIAGCGSVDDGSSGSSMPGVQTSASTVGESLQSKTGSGTHSASSPVAAVAAAQESPFSQTASGSAVATRVRSTHQANLTDRVARTSTTGAN